MGRVPRSLRRCAYSRFHLRYGDPKEALMKLNNPQSQEHGTELFLNARIDRSPNSNLAALRTFMEKRLPEERGYGLSLRLANRRRVQAGEDYLYDQLLHWPNNQDLRERRRRLYSVLTLKNFRARPALHAGRQAPRPSRLLAASGNWPDFCSDPDLPYNCKAEAAKLG